MANTKSAKKAARASARKTDVNKSRRTRMRNLVKKVEAALESKDATAAAEALKNAEPVYGTRCPAGRDPPQYGIAQGRAVGQAGEIAERLIDSVPSGANPKAQPVRLGLFACVKAAAILQSCKSFDEKYTPTERFSA